MTGDLAPTLGEMGTLVGIFKSVRILVTSLAEALPDDNGAQEGTENAPADSDAIDGDDDVDDDDEDEDELEGQTKLDPDDPRVVRATYGMPDSNTHVLDIGPITQEAWASMLLSAKSVLWIDAIGAVEYQDFCAGSQALLDALMPDDSEDNDTDVMDAENMKDTGEDGDGEKSSGRPTVALVGERCWC